MSRSNSLIARQIRENESLQTRKTILKAGGSARKQEQAALEVAKADEAFMKKFKELKRFTKKSKDVKNIVTQKTEWVEGENYLRKQERIVENEISTLLQKIIMFSLHDGRMAEVQSTREPFSSRLNDYVTAFATDHLNREDNQRAVTNQLHEMKGMLKRTKQAINACAHHSELTDGAPLLIEEEKRNCAVAVFADVLMQVRNAHRSTWVHLTEEAQRLQEEVNSAVMAVCQLQSENRRDVHNYRACEELEAMDTDTVQVLALLEEWKQKIYACDDHLQRELMILSEEREATHRSYCDACGVDSSEPYGDWCEEDHTIFVKEAKRAQTQGAQRHKLTTVLGGQLPHMSATDISRHENWYRAIKSIGEKKKLLLQSGEAKREALLEETRRSMAVARKKATEDRVFAEEQEKHERARAELHQLLNLQRIQRLNDMEARLAEVNELRVQADEKQRREEERREAETRHKKIMAEQFKADRRAYLEAQRAREEQQRKEEAEERKRQVEAAKEHVDHREALRLRKIEENRKKEAALLEEDARRIDMLNRLAEQVPYFEALQNASSKLDHITAAVEAQKYMKPEDMSRGHLALNGFTDKEIFKDARFRLGLALREAGVHQSAAAAAVIRQMNPRPMAPW